MSDITQILEASGNGDPGASARLFEMVYDRLRQIAVEKMSRESPGHTLQATALVHEAWLRLGGDHQPQWQNRAHFFGAAAEAMRRLLVDRARRKRTQRLGGGALHLDIQDVEVAMPSTDEELLSVHESLDRFADVHPKRAQLVKLHYFVGMTLGQSAEVLDISEATAKRWWVFSKAWLFREIVNSRR